MKMKNMTVNRLPAKTWNWLGMNESRLHEMQIDKKGAVISESIPFIEKNQVKGSDETGQKDGQLLGNSVCAADWSRIETGMGKDMEQLFADSPAAEADLFYIHDEKDAEPVVLTYQYDIGKSSGNVLHIYAEKNSRFTGVLLHRSAEAPDFQKAQAAGNTVQTAGHAAQSGGNAAQVAAASSSLAAFQVKIHAREGAQVKLFLSQLLDDSFTSLYDIGAYCEKNAEVEIIKLELGAGKVYAGGKFLLEGAGSQAKLTLGYLGRNGQRLDMNYVAQHVGEKTESRMEASGVLKEGAFKLFRGTIDFVHGCRGAKGTETENVLLLGENAGNQTIPLILCGEEDVEGNHGATIGRLDEKILFYLASRGLSEEEAKQIVARARLEAINSLIPSQAVQRETQEFLERIGNEKL